MKPFRDANFATTGKTVEYREDLRDDTAQLLFFRLNSEGIGDEPSPERELRLELIAAKTR
jgi:hypothetical protein